MVREDILGGLKTALARGQTLRQAMMSFYNSGYLKQEIEEAAKALQVEKNQPLQPQFAQGPSETAPIFQRTDLVEKDSNEEPKEVLSQTAKLAQPQTIQKVSAYGQPTQPTQPKQPQQVQQPAQQSTQTIQKVSAYGQPAQPTQPKQPQQVQQPQPAKPRGKAIIFILLALLIILIGGLIVVFFFKDKLLTFFNSS